MTGDRIRRPKDSRQAAEAAFKTATTKPSEPAPERPPLPNVKELVSLRIDTGGPLRSIQLMVNVSPSIPQETSTRPVFIESAPVLAGIGGEFVEREPDRLRRSRVQAQFEVAHGDARTNEVGEMRELCVN